MMNFNIARGSRVPSQAHNTHTARLAAWLCDAWNGSRPTAGTASDLAQCTS